MRTKLKTIICVLVTLAVSPALALGDTAALGNLSVTGTLPAEWVSSRTVGWTFDVGGTNITVTRLGVYDDLGDGLASDHPIGLWDSSGNLLTPDVTIPPGSGSELIGGYRYVDIAPVELVAGQTYTIGVIVGQIAPNDNVIQYATADADPAITMIPYPGYDYLSWAAYGEALAMPNDWLNDQQGFNANFQFTTETPEPIPVDIDIKPGSYPNTINLGSNGVVPVGILSSEDFDATTVDPDTVALAGSGVAIRGKGNKYLAHEEDVNDDGLVDLVLQVETENLDPEQFQDGYAILTGATYDGQAIEGMDEITIVPPE